MTRVLSLATLFAAIALASACDKKPTRDFNDNPNPAPPPGPAMDPDGIGLTDTAAKAEALKRLKQIGIAMHNFENTHGYLPAGIVGPKGELGLSWRVAILPYLESKEDAALIKEFKLNEPWDSEHNRKLLAKMPNVFESPGKSSPEGKTHLRSFAGESAFLRPPPVGFVPKGQKPPPPYPNVPAGTTARGRSFADFSDGTSNTLAVAEAAEPVEWTKPEDLPFPGFGFDPNPPPVPRLGGPFAGGFHALMTDGAAHFFPATVPEKVVGMMITVNRGEVLPKEATEVLFPPRPKKNQPPESIPSDLPDAAARKSAVANFVAIYKAMDEFDEFVAHLPAGIGTGKTVGLSWRVQLLPHLGHDALYKEFKLTEPWDSEHNKKLIEKMPKVFESPGKPAEKGHTFVRTTEGQAAIIPLRPDGKPQLRPDPGTPAFGLRLAAGIPDGASNTILFFEAAEAVPWTKPGDLPFAGPGTPVPGKGGRFELPKDPKIPKLGGPFADGFHAVMGDGRVTFYKNDFPAAELAKLLCPNDGWVVDLFLEPSRVLYSIPLPTPPKKPLPPGKEPTPAPPKPPSK